MANSHEGNISLAKKITKAAAISGADAIKFQKFTADELATPDHENYKLYKRLEMSPKDWKQLISYAKSQKLRVFVDIFGLKSAKFILQNNIDGFKIHSSDISNLKLLQLLSKTKQPILISTAGSNINELFEIIQLFQNKTREIVLMHGFQGYPTSIKDTQLLKIRALKNIFGLPIGIMDHTSGDSKMAKILPLLGLAMGAVVIEKHITLDRSKKGLDYYSALNPCEFKDFVSLCKLASRALGTKSLELSKREVTYREIHKKNPVAKLDIKKGTKLTSNLFEFKRTRKKHGISLYDFQNRYSTKFIKKGSILDNTMFENYPPHVVAIIACRVDSTRLYAKPLQLIGKYRLLELLLKQIKQSSYIDEVVLAISEGLGNEPFVDFAVKNGLKFIRGDDNDVLQRLIQAAKLVNADIIFRATPDCPYIYWKGIDALIQKHISGNFDLSFYEKVPLGSCYEIMNLESLEISHRRGLSRHRSELVTLFMMENQKKFKINKMLPPKIFQRPEIRITVDSPEDLMVARLIHKKLGKNDTPIPLENIIKFLDNNPQIKKINFNIPIGVSRIWY
jgi:N,N'-diacetyllegionaminate synthase